MPIWIALPLSCWFGYLSLWPLAWLTSFLRIFLFFFMHHQEYRLRTSHGRQDFSKDLGVVLAKNPILSQVTPWINPGVCP